MASAKMEHNTENSKPRLLLVVSDDLIRDIFRKLFERTGYQAVAVESAKDGLETLIDECFDVVICDFDLYDAKGVEFFDSTKNICPDRINILMITPGDPLNVQKIKKLNIRHIIEKPFSFEELLRIIKNSHLKN